jgi:bifunctional dethiobiotin synthetase / adenosylmethionine---8-amino-7-oxononanoate aminotransferase
VCREERVPVIADEVFAGLWRLGHPSACQALNIQPDVACFAKLLTAGAVPMSVTLASEDVFKAFEGDSKAQALLHGHSYTAHPVGCQVATYDVFIYC